MKKTLGHVDHGVLLSDRRSTSFQWSAKGLESRFFLAWQRVSLACCTVRYVETKSNQGREDSPGLIRAQRTESESESRLRLVDAARLCSHQKKVNAILPRLYTYVRILIHYTMVVLPTRIYTGTYTSSAPPTGRITITYRIAAGGQKYRVNKIEGSLISSAR